VLWFYSNLLYLPHYGYVVYKYIEICTKNHPWSLGTLSVINGKSRYKILS